MAAQDAEMRLRISLDLTSLRRQLNTVGTQLAGQPLYLPFKLDKTLISSEYKLLERYIGRKKFNIEIKSNLSSEIEKAQKLSVLLKSMPAGKSGTPGAIYNRTAGTEVRTRALSKLLRGPGAGGFDATQITKLAEAAIKAGVEGIDITQSATKLRGLMRDAFQQAGDDSSRGLVNALVDGRTAVGKAAAGLAEETLNTLRTSLQTQSPSKKTEKIGKDVGKGFEIGSVSSMAKAYDAIEALMKMRNKGLDALARAAFMAFGIDPAALKAARSQTMQSAAQMMAAANSPSGGVAGLLPPSTAKGRLGRLMDAGGGGASVAQGPGVLAQRGRPDFRVREVNVREIFDTREFQFLTLRIFSVIGDALESAANQAKTARIDSSVKNLMQSIDNAVKLAQAQVRNARGAFTGQVQVSDLGRTERGLPAGRVAGLLPAVSGGFTAAAGRSPSPYSSRETQAEFFARKEREARMRTMFGEAPQHFSQQLKLPPARPRGLGAPPLYTAPSIPSTGESTYLGNRTGSSVRTRTPGGFIGGAPPSGGGPEAGAFVNAARNALRYSEALKISKTSLDGFRVSQLPMIGGLRELGGEFGMAMKQVILYGTAYKGLAFITSLPGQILNAAKSQQQFSNAMQVATQDTGTFAKEMLYVDNVQRAFGLSLETTRTGFTRLYASMAPTGFDSGSIEKLFTGISAATAALQLTPDKAERVIYAFGQMASKGQIMSEELKGQLGDVLPGALAIFAKSAGMSVKEFSKAMEDGEFVGNRFREVFAKVSDELMNRFGTGAQAAGKSLQGLLNTVGGDFTRTLESFAPLANAAAQAVLGPMSGALKQLAMAAQIAMGEVDRVGAQVGEAQKTVVELKIGKADNSEIRAAEQSLAALTAKYEGLQAAARDPAIDNQVRSFQAFTEELTKAGTFVLNLAQNIGSFLSPILNFLGTNLTTVISLVTSLYIGFQAARLATLAVMSAMILLKTVMAALGLGSVAVSANALSGALGILGVSASGATVKLVGLKFALMTIVSATVIGAVVTGIALIAGAFATMRDRAGEASQASKDAAQSAVEAASTGSTAQAAMAVQSILAQDRADAAALRTLKAIQQRSTKDQRSGAVSMQLTPQESIALAGSPLTKGILDAGVTRGGRREIRVPSSAETSTITGQFGSAAGQRKVSLQEAKASQVEAQRVATLTGQNVPTPGTLPPETEEPDKAAANKARADLESQRSLEDRLAKNFTQDQIERENIKHDAKVTLMNNFYDLQEARANSYQKETIRFHKEIYNIMAEQEGAAKKAQAEIMKARGSVAGGAPSAPLLPPPAGKGGAFDTGMRTGPSSAIGGRGSAAYHQDIMFGSTVSMKERVQLVDQLARGYEALGRTIEFSNAGVAGSRYRSEMSYEAKSSLISRAQVAHANRPGGSGRAAMDYYAPLASQDRFGPSVEGQAMLAPSVPGASYSHGAGGRSGRTMRATRDGAMVFEQLHGSTAVPLSTGAVAPQRVLPSVKRDIVAKQQTQLAIGREQLSLTLKEAEATQKLDIAMQNYVANMVPVAEQDLQNQIMAKRIELTAQSTSPAILDAQIKYAEQEARATDGIRLNDAAIKDLSNTKDANGKVTAEAAAQIAILSAANVKLEQSLPTSKIQLLTEAIERQRLGIIERTKASQIEAEDNRQINRLIIEGMTRQKAEAKVAADRFRGDYVTALSMADQEVMKLAASVEVLKAAQAPNGAQTDEQIQKFKELADALEKAKKRKDELEGKAPAVEQGAQAVESAATIKPGDMLSSEIAKATENLQKMVDIETMGIAIAGNISQAFGTAFKGIITGSMTAREALASFFQSLADSFADMVTQMITEYLKLQLIQGIQSIIGAIGGGSFGSIAPGPVAKSAGVVPRKGFFGPAFANGGIAPGGFQAFANGGIVTGPTMGLVGEGRYNEAVVPLPDGRSIPVDMGGAMGPQINSSIVVNVSSDGQSSSRSAGSDSAGLGRKLEGAVKQVIVDELRPGGLLARR